MPSLASMTGSLFPQTSRQRGKDYFRAGRVTLGTVSAGQASATVRGSETYTVSLKADPPTLNGFCSCPAFERLGPCKHLWATILAIDASGRAFLPEGVRPIEDLDEAASADDFSTEDERDLDRDDDLDDDVERERNVIRGPWNRRNRFGGERSAPRERDTWRRDLRALATVGGADGVRGYEDWAEKDQLLYVIEAGQHGTGAGSDLTLNVVSRKRRRDGEWGKLKNRAVAARFVARFPDEQDRLIVTSLLGCGDSYGYYGYGSGKSSFLMSSASQQVLIPLLARTGRFCVRHADQSVTPLMLDEGAAWELVLSVEPGLGLRHYELKGLLRRGEESRPLREAATVSRGWVFWNDAVARLNSPTRLDWFGLLLRPQPCRIPAARAAEFIQELANMAELPVLALPAELQHQRMQGTPLPHLLISRPKRDLIGKLKGVVRFEYEGIRVPPRPAATGVYVPEKRSLILRDLTGEQARLARLAELGFVENRWDNDGSYELSDRKLSDAVRTLLADGWQVQAENGLYRRAGRCTASVASGIDWFELRGEVEFDGKAVPLPRLLEALRKKQDYVRLDDGSLGLLPEEWLKKYELLGDIGQADEDCIRFKAGQVAVLDALLATQPEVSCDEAFNRIREQLRSFESIQPLDAPPGFGGTLRHYQRDGLGWLRFLETFGLGGILADDMGLGKTVQVLALLDLRRQDAAQERAGKGAGPSLVVVPRSLIFNWVEEAKRFTPEMRVLVHAGLTRTRTSCKHLRDYDMVLTTYGTLRRDITVLKDLEFDYAILDEAQAIKNALTASAKAARLLQARHRLCMTGTPIENHLGELWSQLEFLNPGMFGRSGGRSLPDQRTMVDTDRAMLARMLRPLILRRLKEQVAKDLPARSEQTLHCPLDKRQRQQYDQLRDHYRLALLKGMSANKLARSKIQVLEALLRLRQVACHPGLLDPSQADEPSAKLDALMAQLAEVLESGHKALVFSQFTSFLAIVQARLKREGIVYEYLDGQTRDRQARVERFQNDPDCRLFLISLKAGGLGLNLTAADYVFLLDPWWNPAVEAQAIDRAHRIGQTQHVFAYRLIASDTVEQRVLELQQTKRALADSILSADNRLIADLKPEDLELLLS